MASTPSENQPRKLLIRVLVNKHEHDRITAAAKAAANGDKVSLSSYLRNAGLEKADGDSVLFGGAGGGGMSGQVAAFGKKAKASRAK